MASSPKARLQPSFDARPTAEDRLGTRMLVFRRVTEPIDGVVELRDAAVRIDRVGCSNADDDRGLDAFGALTDGPWTLVDRFDRGGRRYLVARCDTSTERPRVGLSRRERQVTKLVVLGHSNKEIAYTLRIAPSTVSSHLRTAMRRLGVTTRAELAACLATAQPALSEEDR